MVVGVGVDLKDVLWPVEGGLLWVASGRLWWPVGKTIGGLVEKAGLQAGWVAGWVFGQLRGGV